MPRVLEGGEHVSVSRRPLRWWNMAALLAIVALVATVVLVEHALDWADKVNLADLAAVAIAAAVAETAVVTWASGRGAELVGHGLFSTICLSHETSACWCEQSAPTVALGTLNSHLVETAEVVIWGVV
jgi:hypothetical protein